MASADRPHALTSRTIYLLSQVAKTAKRELDDRLAEQGLRLRHMAALAAVIDAPSAQGELGRLLNLDPSDVTATIDDLEARRYVTRKVDPADRRRRQVAPTARGRRELELLNGLADDIADRMLAPIPADRRRQLHDDLRRILSVQDGAPESGDAS